jgi:hypothetical protein
MRRFKATILLAIFSFTVLGFNLEGHYCGGTLTDISIVGKSHCEGSCSSHEMIHEESDHQDHTNKKCAKKSDCEKDCESKSDKDCCKTEKLSDLSDLEYAVQLNFVSPIVFLSVLLDYSVFEAKERAPETAWDDYHEPIPDKDRQVLHQSFLI